jgi:predicted phosphodiesterase
VSGGLVSGGSGGEDDILDLGAIEEPLLLFGGPYGNREATEALLAEAARRGIPPARIICTGDVAAYCAEPDACVELLAGRGIPTVMGNCEEQLAADAEDCGCGFAADSACAALSNDWYAYCRGVLDRAAKAWMGSLPRRIRFRMGGRELAVVHGAVSAINRFVFPSTPGEELVAEIAAAGADGIVGGHSGIPFVRSVQGMRGADRFWLNAGAVGMPANDGTPRVWFATLAPREAGLRAELHALDYDHAGAARKMRQRGLPEGYAAALLTGLWPSCDVLPPQERAERGRPLPPRGMLWPPPGRSTGRAGQSRAHA